MSGRLEEIKNRRKNYRPDVLPIWFEDMDWLIEQVEHLKGLEESLRQNIKIKQEGIDFLKQENKRYRETINKFFELDGNYKDIVNKAERIFTKALDEALERKE